MDCRQQNGPKYQLCEGYMFSDIVRKTQANLDEKTPPEYYIVIKSKEDDSALACTNKDKTRTSPAG